MSLNEAKSKSRCAKCNQVGHWHRDPECPKNQGNHAVNKTKDINYIEKKPVSDSEGGIFCGLPENEDIEKLGGQDELRATLNPAAVMDQPGNPGRVKSFKDHFGRDNPTEMVDGQMAEQSSFVRDYKDHVCDPGVLCSGFSGPCCDDDLVGNGSRRNFFDDIY